MMEEERAGDLGLLSQVAERIQTEEGRRLFAALVQAHERGGPRAVKDLVTAALGQERELRPEDAEGEGGHEG